MSIENWIALASSLVGMAAAIAAMLTVLEMRRQRRSLYKPEIALVTHNWELCVSGESFSAASWQLSRGEEETKEKYLKRDIPVQVFNVGSGAGKDLVIKFSYDIKGFIDALAIMKETRWTIKYNHPMLTLKEIATKYESFDMVANQEIHPRIAYLLPANTQPEGISINLPSGYGLLMKAYFLSLCRVDTETLKQYSLPLPIEVTLESHDIEGNKCTARFKLQPEFNFVRKPDFSQSSNVVASGFINVS